MRGKGPSLFVQLNSLPKISRVSGKFAATVTPPIPGRRTGSPNWRLLIADCSDIVFLFWRCSRGRWPRLFSVVARVSRALSWHAFLQPTRLLPVGVHGGCQNLSLSLFPENGTL